MVKKFKKSVLLTGAAGFLGKYMVKACLNAGFHVIATDVNVEGLKNFDTAGGNLEIVKVDMLKEDLVPLFKRVVEECEEPYMINIAGLFVFDAPAMALFLINVRLTKNVMATALKVGGWKHIVQISTVGTYGTPANNRESKSKSSWYTDLKPYNESDPQIPDNIYGITKFMGENCAWRYYRRGLPISVVRPSLIYGPENRYGAAIFLHYAAFVRNMAKGPLKFALLLPILFPCRGGTWASFGHAEDISGGAVYILQKPETIGEAYNIADPSPLNTIAFSNLMFHTERVKFKWRYIPLSRFLIQQYQMIFRKEVTKFAEWLFRILLKIHELIMHYDSSQIPIELSRDWIGYFKSNFIWDVSKLKALGYQWKYPNIKKGILENVIWYKKNKWLP